MPARNVMPAHIRRGDADELRTRGRLGGERAYHEQGGREENVSHNLQEAIPRNSCHNLLSHQALSMARRPPWRLRAQHTSVRSMGVKPILLPARDASNQW